MFKRDLRPFAPIGLYLSGLAALVSFVLYIWQRSFNLPLQISLGFIIIGLAVFVILDPQKTREAITGRQARYGSNSLVMSLAFVGIVIVINYLVYNNSKQWDLTEDKQNTLTSDSIKVLESLKTPVVAKAFFTSRMSNTSAQQMLQNYQNSAKGKFSFKFIDPERDPVSAQEAKITRDGTIVLVMDNRQEQVTSVTEQEITGALVRLANPGKRVIYFLTGHGEYAIDGSGDRSYSQSVYILKAKNYTVNTLNLLATPTIPGDALAIVVAGPQKPLTDQEIGLLKAYQEKGGGLIYLAEPRLNTQFGDAADPMASYFSATWGIEMDDDVIIDLSGNNNQPFLVIAGKYNPHPITDKLNSLAVLMPSARSIRAGTAPSGITLTELALTAQNSWGETDIAALRNNQATADPAKDHLGPVSFAVAGDNPNQKSRVVVVGDADFADSSYYNQLGNGDFLLNTIDWAARQDNLISLTPRQPIQRLLVPPTGNTMNLVFLGSVFLLPGLVLFAGIYVWAQRRRRG